MTAFFTGRYQVHLVVVCLVLLFLQATYIFRCDDTPLQAWRKSHRVTGYPLPNATLGFERILSFTSEQQNDPRAWRYDGLVKAANRTGLQIDVLRSRVPTVHEISALRESTQDTRKPNQAQALAWLAHLDMLKYVIKNNFQTALILEDDADWDVAIRNQLAPVASAVRNVTNSTLPEHYYPYGMSWDVLWLGHCGDLPKPEVADPIFIDDQTVLSTPKLRSAWIGEHLDYSTFPNQTRSVQYSHGPVCTFGYAVTAAGARKTLAWASQTAEAWDICLHEGCRAGEYDCVTVKPEVIHQQRHPGARTVTDGGAREEDKDDEDMKKTFTHNIWHSARCNAENWDNGNLTSCLPSPKQFEKYNC